MGQGCFEMRLPSKTLEKKLLQSGYNQVIGVDEVGMGCLAGPVVVCAVMLGKQFFAKSHKKLVGIRDSKLLSANQRETLATELRKTSGFHYQLAYCYPKTIDRLNIYQASRLAMKRAVSSLANSKSQILNTKQTQSSKSNSLKPLNFDIVSDLDIRNLDFRTIVLVDGNKKIPKLDLPQLTITGGDRKVFSIACASIIAKVHRDRMMTNYAIKYPDYGFEKHKGYGTKFHQVALTNFGPTPIHRRSFRLEY